jgi:ATP-dependent DNA helicase RecG
VLRNPKIADMLHRADYIEKMGTGVRKMQRLMSEAGLAPLEFTFTSFFTVTFRKPVAMKEKIVGEGYWTIAERNIVSGRFFTGLP